MVKQMSARRTTTAVLVSTAMTVLAIGCGGGDGRVTQVAIDAADRQAEQNREMARVNRHLAEGTKRLVEADAVSRRETLAIQRDLQEQQAHVGRQRDVLETERRVIAGQRRTESVVVPALKTLGAAAVVAVTIGFCWLLLFGLRRHDDSDPVLCDLLVQDMVLAERSPVLTLPPDRNEPIPEAIEGPDSETPSTSEA